MNYSGNVIQLFPKADRQMRSKKEIALQYSRITLVHIFHIVRSILKTLLRFAYGVFCAWGRLLLVHPITALVLLGVVLYASGSYYQHSVEKYWISSNKIEVRRNEAK